MNADWNDDSTAGDRWSDDAVDDAFAAITAGLDEAADETPSVFRADGDNVVVDLPAPARMFVAALFFARADRIRHGDGQTVRPTDDDTTAEQAATMAMAIDEARLDSLEVDVTATVLDRDTAWRWARALSDVRLWLIGLAGGNLGPHRGTVPVAGAADEAEFHAQLVGALLAELIEAMRA